MRQHSLLQATLAPEPTLDNIFHELITHERPTFAFLSGLSLLGQLLSTSQRQAIAARWSDLRFNLACHSLTEFPNYSASPVDRTDEPLFFRSEYYESRSIGKWATFQNGHLTTAPRLAPYSPCEHFVATGKCLHGMVVNSCSACEDNNRSGKTNPHRDKYLLHLTYCGPEISAPNSLAFDATGIDEVDVVDLLAAELADNISAPEVMKFVDLPLEPWMDRSRETFLNLYGPLLEQSRAWEDIHTHRVEVVTDAEYKKRHKNAEGVTVPHVPTWCGSCLMHVTVLHDSTQCAAKLLTEQKHAAEMQAARREARGQRLAALNAQGYWSSDRRDGDIVEARRGTVEGDVITKFDRDLSRKGNKYLIQ